MPCRQKSFTLPPIKLLHPDWIRTVQGNINNLVHPPGVYRITLMAHQAPDVQLVAWYNQLVQNNPQIVSTTLEGVKSWLLDRYFPTDPSNLGFVHGEGGIVSLEVPQSSWAQDNQIEEELINELRSSAPDNIRLYGIYRTLESYRIAYWAMSDNNLLPSGRFPREVADNIKRRIVESFPFRITPSLITGRNLSLEDEFFIRMEERSNAV